MTGGTGQQELDQLFREVVSQMSAKLAAFAASIRTGSACADDHEDACTIAHSLLGSGTLYGYPCVSELGASLEKMVEALQGGRVRRTPAVANLIESCSAALFLLANLAVPDEPARARARDLAWECECVLHAAAAPASDPPAEEAASPQAP